MARQTQPRTDKSAAAHYRLKTGAMERLVNAGHAPRVSEAEIRKYSSKGRFRLPHWLKVVLLKWWFAGAVCYFFLWGLGIYLHGLDLLVSLAIGLGVTTDLMLNRILHNFESAEGANDKWMMVTAKGFHTFFLNIAYAALVLFCVFQTYYGINTGLGVDARADMSTAETMLGVEPILFGLLYLGFDLLFLKIRNTLIRIFRDARETADGCRKDGIVHD